jgi:uncharacterized protein HemX
MPTMARWSPPPTQGGKSKARKSPRRTVTQPEVSTTASDEKRQSAAQARSYACRVSPFAVACPDPNCTAPEAVHVVLLLLAALAIFFAVWSWWRSRYRR